MKYEFCVPNKTKRLRKVAEIDASAEVQGDASRRFVCEEDQVLFLGSTHQRDYETTLRKLGKKRWIERIEMAFD